MSREEGRGAPAPRTVPCPTCGEKSVFEPWNPWRPFCCERCRALDLGAWASEKYVISTPANPPPPEDDTDE
jgi:endogenous inhibitor of DNA gyrase (YacG/DUF329 family)